jgi:hypothetical protein
LADARLEELICGSHEAFLQLRGRHSLRCFLELRAGNQQIQRIAWRRIKGQRPWPWERPATGAVPQ